MGSSTALRKRPLVIAHRGASAYLPEHTLAAKALAHAMGADFVEQDVVLSRDGVPVVLHDIYLESTTDVAARFPKRARGDGSFYAIDFTLEELRQLRVHERGWRDQGGKHSAYYAKRFPPQPGLFQVPTLEEELALVEGLNKSMGRCTGIYLELKAPNWHLEAGQDMVPAVVKVLDDAGYLQRPDQVFLQCFDDSTLKRLARELPAPVPLIQLIGENDWGEDSAADYEKMRTPEGLADIAGYAAGIGPHLPQVLTGTDADGSAQLSDLVDQAHAKGLEVHPYTFRRDELPAGIPSFEALLDVFIEQAGVDGLFTDFPDLAVRYLANRA
ncbi:MAG: glycerophosphodiester phosphodiesterase [Halioglobus sp.]